ncbi:MAG: hypothetical protein GX601_01430 [Anaerolineales bacterium]|nr:hypothetical protein [Anaerolineales bacterium]
MKREHLTWIGAALAAVAAGLLISQTAALPTSAAQGSLFRQWLWDRRALDLLVQVGLILVGALGIAALLPRGREDHEG